MQRNAKKRKRIEDKGRSLNRLIMSNEPLTASLKQLGRALALNGVAPSQLIKVKGKKPLFLKSLNH